jgi:hypothetical protein
MPAFKEFDWRRLDVTAIVTFGGVASVEKGRHAGVREWLAGEGYGIDTIDFTAGLSAAVPALGKLLGWEEQFGYALASDSRNLDALRDGFDFGIPEGGGRVFEVLGGEIAWREDPRWFGGVLSIAQEHCREQLALGRRFFALLVLSEKSPLVGWAFDQVVVPYPHWNG